MGPSAWEKPAGEGGRPLQVPVSLQVNTGVPAHGTAGRGQFPGHTYCDVSLCHSDFPQLCSGRTERCQTQDSPCLPSTESGYYLIKFPSTLVTKIQIEGKCTHNSKTTQPVLFFRLPICLHDTIPYSALLACIFLCHTTEKSSF